MNTTTPRSRRAPSPPPITSFMDRRLSVVGIGLAMACIGILAPWVTVRSVFGTMSVHGYETDDGKVALIAILVMGLSLLFVKLSMLIVLSFGLIALAVYDMVDVARTINGADGEFVQASVGWGLWLLLIGAAVTFVGSIRAAR